MCGSQAAPAELCPPRPARRPAGLMQWKLASCQREREVERVKAPKGNSCAAASSSPARCSRLPQPRCLSASHLSHLLLIKTPPPARLP